MRFASPYFLILLFFIPLFIFYILKLKKSSHMTFSDISTFNRIRKQGITKFRSVLWMMRIAAVTLLIISTARPQYGRKELLIPTEVVDIMLVLDVSQSMAAQDFNPNRLAAAKESAQEFIEGRNYDRIGITVYATSAFTLCPLTIDHSVLSNFLSGVDFGMVDGSRTAIGTGLATAVKRMKTSEAKSKIIILLTDGESNFGKIDPVTAANIAKTYGIKVYTVGVGSEGTVMIPVDDPIFGRRSRPMQVSLDEDTLKEIASITGGKYYRAVDNKKLDEIYKEIDKEEKTEIEIEEHFDYEELMAYFASPALILIMLEFILANTRFRKLP